MGQLGGGARRPGKADFCQRALPAQGRAVGQAHGGPQLHERLRERAAVPFRVDLAKRLSYLFFYLRQVDRAVVRHHAHDYAQHVAIHSRRGLLKANGRHCARRIRADARQLFERFGSIGKSAVLRFGEELCRFLQISCAGVIAESFPEL